jgi:hypothetical protein
MILTVKNMNSKSYEWCHFKNQILLNFTACAVEPHRITAPVLPKMVWVLAAPAPSHYMSLSNQYGIWFE